jgi:hypothetical protein
MIFGRNDLVTHDDFGDYHNEVAIAYINLINMRSLSTRGGVFLGIDLIDDGCRENQDEGDESVAYAVSNGTIADVLSSIYMCLGLVLER